MTHKFPRPAILASLMAFLTVSAAQAACSSAYYPVKEGFSRTYQTAIQGKTMTYTETISKVSGSGFTYSNSMMKEMTSTMKCDSKGIVGVTQSVMPGMKITESHGTAWPSSIKVGSTWAYGFTMKGNIQGQAVEQVMDMKSKVLGQEKVTVKAGTFTALKVETTTSMNMVMGGQKMNQPPMKSVAWLAQGVGMVKSTAAGATVELVKYTK